MSSQNIHHTTVPHGGRPVHWGLQTVVFQKLIFIIRAFSLNNALFASSVDISLA
jgi:hypothetical protein